MEGFVREWQGFSVTSLEPDFAAQARGHQASGAFDLPGVWINAHDAPDDSGNPPGKTAVAAADI